MMKESMIQVICGPGRGKTTSAIGRGLTALTKGKCVYMVQFLKGALDADNMEIIQRLEPEFKIFRFEKTPVFFDQLTEEEKNEARICIRNGLNFAKKVLVTGECDIPYRPGKAGWNQADTYRQCVSGLPGCMRG